MSVPPRTVRDMALRLLHTSDWHLGHVLHGFDRAHEHALALEWLLEAVVREEIDALLVAGDVFDAANPPTEAQQLWYRFLVEAWARVPHLQIVVVGGNHDSASRLDAIDPFLRALKRLHVVGGVARSGGEVDLDRHVIALRDRAGATAAWVAAVPHLRATETGTGDEAAVAAGTRAFYDAVFARARARRRAGEALLAMGHLYLVGAQVSSLSERKLTLGNQSAVGHDLFPGDVAYAALGHLHLAQPVGGREHVRYSGSLIPLSLAERDYPHQAVVVELEGERTLAIRALRAPRSVALPRIPTQGALGLAEALAAIAALPARGDGPDCARPLLEVEVRVEKPEPTLRQKVEEALRGKEARLARLGVTVTGSGASLREQDVRSISELQPEEVFRAKWTKHHQGDPPADLVSAFHELVDLVHQEVA
jgi:DNA repair protein SbcD/Mre11